jgi:hypothetical protein
MWVDNAVEYAFKEDVCLSDEQRRERIQRINLHHIGDDTLPNHKE